MTAHGAKRKTPSGPKQPNTWVPNKLKPVWDSHLHMRIKAFRHQKLERSKLREPQGAYNVILPRTGTTS